MSSPGRLVLHVARIAKAFWACVGDLSVHDPAVQRLLCEASVFLVYAHERFHHSCDVLGRVTGCRGGAGDNYKSDWQMEEALATAYSWRELQRSWPNAAMLAPALEKAFLDWWFEAITAEGYKDWRRFRAWFDAPVSFHLLVESTWSLLSNIGCQASDWLCRSLDDGAWYEHSAERWLEIDNRSIPIQAKDDRAPRRSKRKGDLRLKAHIDSWYRGLSSNLYTGDLVLSRGCRFNKQSDLTGFRLPHKIIGSLLVCGCPIASIYGSPSFISGDVLLCDTQLDSFQNIHKWVKHIGGVIWFLGSPITSHILGLLLIDGLERVVTVGLTGPLRQACEVLNAYLPNKRGMAGVNACQDELIEADLEDFAEL
jgi:hypothetical protein